MGDGEATTEEVVPNGLVRIIADDTAEGWCYVERDSELHKHYMAILEEKDAATRATEKKAKQ